MNPSTALATVLVDELIRCGVREVVLAPGSRSAPLAYAVQQAERAGRLRLHVRVDERSAAFLALGLAKVSRRPAVVVTTSGTAVANLHPAVLEAHHAAVPLIVLTADRPEELRGTGANQTTVQPGIFAGAVRWERDLPNFPGSFAGPARIFGAVLQIHPSWRTTVDRAWAAATGALGSVPGPVHLNVAFRDPLAPDLAEGGDPADGTNPVDVSDAGDGSGPADRPELAGRPDGQPWTLVRRGQPGQPGQPVEQGIADGARTDLACSDLTPTHRTEGPATLMILGDLLDPELARRALAAATAYDWPVVAEPFGAGDRSPVLPHGSLLLTAQDWVDRHLPDRVLVVGRCTLNRETGALLRRAGVRVEAVAGSDTWTDPSHVVARVHEWHALTTGELAGQDAEWARTWRSAGTALTSTVTPLIDDSWPSGPAVAACVLAAMEHADLLVLGSSNPARDVDRVGLAGRSLLVTGNRGLAGIDGTNATALGLALAAPGRRVVSLVGDLTFLHDLNGLLVGPQEPQPDNLTIVVVNDDGGGIFTTLEYGDPHRVVDFERVFGTPTGADLGAACTAYGVAHERVSQAGELAEALARPHRGIRVLEVSVPRDGHRDLRAALAAAAADALR